MHGLCAEKQPIHSGTRQAAPFAECADDAVSRVPDRRTGAGYGDGKSCRRNQFVCRDRF